MHALSVCSASKAWWPLFLHALLPVVFLHCFSMLLVSMPLFQACKAAEMRFISVLHLVGSKCAVSHTTPTIVPTLESCKTIAWTTDETPVIVLNQMERTRVQALVEL